MIGTNTTCARQNEKQTINRHQIKLNRPCEEEEEELLIMAVLLLDVVAPD